MLNDWLDQSSAVFVLLTRGFRLFCFYARQSLIASIFSKLARSGVVRMLDLKPIEGSALDFYPRVQLDPDRTKGDSRA